MSSSKPSRFTQADIIILQVGEQQFRTTAATLTSQSTFFWNLLSDPRQKSTNNIYFIDADGETFTHILRYLRNNVFPLFYSASSGFDFGLYNAVLEQSHYFQIPPLEQWIKDKQYLNAVKTTIEAHEVPNLTSLKKIVSAGGDIQCYPAMMVRKVYICPRGIPGHKGYPEKCGKLCHKAQSDAGEEYVEERSWKAVVVEKQTTFHPEVCNSDLGKQQ